MKNATNLEALRPQTLAVLQKAIVDHLDFLARGQGSRLAGCAQCVFENRFMSSGFVTTGGADIIRDELATLGLVW